MRKIIRKITEVLERKQIMTGKDILKTYFYQLDKTYMAAFLAISGLLTESLSLLYPGILGRILDVITIQKDSGLFTFLCLAYVVVFLAEKFLCVGEEWLRLRTRRAMELSVKKKMLKSMLLSKPGTGDMEAGKASELLLDGTESVILYFETGVDFIKNIIKILFVLIIMLNIDWRIFAGSVVLLPAYAGLSWRTGKRVKEKGEEKEKEYQGFRSWFVEVLAGMQTIRKYDMQGKIKRLTRERERSYIDKTRRFLLADLRAEFMTQLFMQFLNFFLYILSACFITQGRLTIGSYVMIFEYYYVMQSSIVKMGALYRQAHEKSSLMRQMTSFLNQMSAPAAKGLCEGIDGRIECRNINFSYPGEKRLLDGCSFCIESGEEAAVSAESGAGKSTLLKVIAGIYEAEGGAVYLGRHRIEEYDPEYLRSKVIYFVQEKILLYDTLKENVALGKTFPDERIWRVLEKVGLADVVKKLPQELDTRIGGQNSCLSEGEYQRLNFARVLLMAPRILIIDEGTISLDVEAEKEIRKLLKKELAGVTILFVTHRKESIHGAERILYLNKGRINEKNYR